MGFVIEIFGEYANFTRPEHKTERLSYDIITPSAARAVFEAILWKPAIKWNIHKIEVLNPINWVNVRRNEVGAVLPVGNINKAMKGGPLPSLIIEKERQQRASLILKDVAYRIHASFDMTDKAGKSDNPGKFADMFKRRAQKGQCFNQPYLGSREFSCGFKLVEKNEITHKPIDINKDLGWMLYDMDYTDSPNIKPLFFNATMKKGVIHVPDHNSDEVRG